MFEQAFKNIDDVLRKEAGCSSELDYTEQTSWLLFLKYLEGLEQDKADEAALERKEQGAKTFPRCRDQGIRFLKHGHIVVPKGIHFPHPMEPIENRLPGNQDPFRISC